jgi:pimeloyl-ACP methyl ester carboxylesterase
VTDRIQLLLLPGLLCDERLWGPQKEALRDVADVEVADLTAQSSIAAMAASALAAAPSRFALAGLSMGGYVAQEIMRQAPDRVDRLALLDTSARADTPEQTERRKGLVALARQGKFKGVTPRLLPLLLHPDRLQDRPLVETVIAMAESVGQTAFFRQQEAIMGRPDGRGDLVRIQCPTLVLCGREDAITPPAVHEEMASAIPSARLVMIERCGHLSTLEQPVEVSNRLRSWLIE